MTTFSKHWKRNEFYYSWMFLTFIKNVVNKACYDSKALRKLHSMVFPCCCLVPTSIPGSLIIKLAHIQIQSLSMLFEPGCLGQIWKGPGLNPSTPIINYKSGKCKWVVQNCHHSKNGTRLRFVLQRCVQNAIIYWTNLALLCRVSVQPPPHLIAADFSANPHKVANCLQMRWESLWESFPSSGFLRRWNSHSIVCSGVNGFDYTWRKLDFALCFPTRFLNANIYTTHVLYGFAHLGGNCHRVTCLQGEWLRRVVKGWWFIIVM